MSSDETRAAERLRQFCHGETEPTAGDQYRLTGQMFDDTCEVLDAYLREHPADDAEPVKNSWLDHHFDYECGLGWSVGKMFVRHDAMSREWIVYARDHEYGQSIELAVIFTRGDVRRLCRALGIELKEQSK